MYTVHCLGLVYFHACSPNDKLALLPDGTKNTGKIPEHFASLFVNLTDYQADTWWPGYTLHHALDVGGTKHQVLEFRIPEPAEVLFGGQGATKVDPGNLEKKLPKLKRIDPSFDVDPNDVDAIARVPINDGTLDVFELNGLASVQWTIDQEVEPIAITATAGGVARTLTLKDAKGVRGTEIVMVNSPFLIKASPATSEDPGHGHGHADHTDHFKLYGKLNKNRDGSKLTPPGAGSHLKTSLPHDHPYIKYLDTLQRLAIPEPGCVPTCC